MANQSKGRKHCKYIRDKTMEIFDEHNMNVPWDKCLLTALENHRNELILDMKSKIIIASHLLTTQPRPVHHPIISHTISRHRDGHFGRWGDSNEYY